MAEEDGRIRTQALWAPTVTEFGNELGRKPTGGCARRLHQQAEADGVRRRQLHGENHEATRPDDTSALRERIHSISSAGDTRVDVGCEVNGIEARRQKIERRERANTKVGSAARQLLCNCARARDELTAYINRRDSKPPLSKSECLASTSTTDVEESLPGMKISIAK